MKARAPLLALLLSAGCAGQPPPIERNPDVFRPALIDRAEFRAGLSESCDALEEVDHVIREAISIGAPIYNAGSALGCYRIYEGAAYKLLYELGGECPELSAFIRAGLGQAAADGRDDRKAWTLRRTFDTILGHGTSADQSPTRSF